MKIALCLLALVTVAMCRSIDERFIIGKFQLNLADVTASLQSALGSDVSEAACETACPSVLAVIPGGSLAAPLLCHPACVELQTLASG